MAKFKIAQAPTFSAKVEIPRVGGEVIKVEFQFKLRDRKELAAMYTDWNKRTTEDHKRLEALGESLTLVELTAVEIDRQVDQVSALVAGWGFADELSEENIRALVETCAGVGPAITDAYQNAYAVTRLGN